MITEVKNILKRHELEILKSPRNYDLNRVVKNTFYSLELELQEAFLSYLRELNKDLNKDT